MWMFLFICFTISFIYFTRSYFSHLYSVLRLMQWTCRDVYSSARNRCRTRRFWLILVPLPLFVSPLLHRQTISVLRNRFFFSFGKRSFMGQGRQNRQGKAQGPCRFFIKKLLNTQRCEGRMTTRVLSRLVRSPVSKKLGLSFTFTTRLPTPRWVFSILLDKKGGHDPLPHPPYSPALHQSESTLNVTEMWACKSKYLIF